MTTAIATPSAPSHASSPTHFLLRRLHSLTGILFGGYVAVHLIVNATIVQGGTVYQDQVDKIHSLPFLLAVEWTFIYLPILYHTIYGCWIILSGQPNNSNYPYFKNTFYLLQRVSAVILIFFIAYHVLSMKGLFGSAMTFDPKNALQSAASGLSAYKLVGYVVYPIGIIAACYHTANGFWTAGISWGLTISAAGQRRWGVCCGALFFVLAGAGLTALAAALVYTPVVAH